VLHISRICMVQPLMSCRRSVFFWEPLLKAVVFLFDDIRRSVIRHDLNCAFEPLIVQTNVLFDY